MAALPIGAAQVRKEVFQAMIFINGYPKVTNASDLEDSSHLAGILAIFEHPEAVDCGKYVFAEEPKAIYKRHPDSIYDFSRDQFICVAAGLIKQGHLEYVNLDYVNGIDIMPPSVRGLVRIAHNKKPYWFQSLWLKGEIYWHSYLQPLDEPNQIIALCSVYGDKYLKLWTKHNKFWEWSITFYFGGYSRDEFIEMLKADKKMGFFRKWFLVRYVLDNGGNWRGEKELAEFIINKIKEKI
jgi:hypothetical protein